MTRSNTLRQAASAVFALTTVVPLLLFVWTVRQLGALRKLEAQVGLGLALAVALAGFFLFRMLMGRMSDLISAVGRVVEISERSATRTRDGDVPPSPIQQPRATKPPAPDAPPSPIGAQTASQEPVAEASHRHVPGLGAIQEVSDLSRAMVILWRAEAAAYKERRVTVSVLNSSRPIVGTLIELTDSGMLLQTDAAERVAVGFDRISSIDLEETSVEL